MNADTIEITAVPIDDEIAARHKARRILWAVLIVSTLISVAGNAAHAVAVAEGSGGSAVMRIIVGAIPAVMLAASIEVLAVLTTHGPHRSTGASVWHRIGGVLVTIAVLSVVGFAFILSYAALVEIGEMYGIPPRVSVYFPLPIDVTIAITVVALAVMPPLTAVSPKRKRKAPTPSRTPSLSVPPTPTAPPRTETPRTPSLSVPAPTAPVPAVTLTPETAPVTVTDEHHAAGARIADSGIVAKPAAVIADVIARLDEGHAQTRIATDTGLNRRTIAKIAAAAETPVRVLAAVGADR